MNSTNEMIVPESPNLICLIQISANLQTWGQPVALYSQNKKKTIRATVPQLCLNPTQYTVQLLTKFVTQVRSQFLNVPKPHSSYGYKKTTRGTVHLDTIT
jgi:hypothetical protein